jgi:hypothetical protein
MLCLICAKIKSKRLKKMGWIGIDRKPPNPIISRLSGKPDQISRG